MGLLPSAFFTCALTQTVALQLVDRAWAIARLPKTAGFQARFYIELEAQEPTSTNHQTPQRA